MANLIKQSSTTQPLMFSMKLGATPVTGLVSGSTLTVTLSKNGGALGSPAGSVSEVGSGVYKVAGNATDNATLGPLWLHATGTGADATDVVFEVVAFDPQDAVHFGLSALPAFAAGAANGLPLGDASGHVGLQTGTGAGQLDFTSGVVKSSLVQILGTALTETAGQIAAGFKQFFNVGSPTSTMNNVTSVGSVSGAVGSVTAGVTVTTNNDKSSYALSSAGIQAVWDALTSALTTAGSVGKRIADFLNAAISAIPTTAAPTTAAIVAAIDPSSTRLAALDRIGNGTAILIQPIVNGGVLVIYRGDDYNSADRVVPNWTENPDSHWPDLTGAAIHLKVQGLDAEGAVDVPNTYPRKVHVDLTAMQTASLTVTTLAAPYRVVAILAGSSREVTLAANQANIMDSVP